MVHYFEPAIDTVRKSAKRKRDDGQSESAANEENQEHSHLPGGADREDEEHVNNSADFSFERKNSRGYSAEKKQQRNIKNQDFIQLNTILHKCLLDQDFVRAGKAFGLLLRIEMSGKHMNLRQKGLWGIGAEILLHRRSSRELNGSPNVDGVGENDNSSLMSRLFTAEGFQVARAYYERLILQYPHKKTRPQDVSSQQFYPAMFGLWIFEAQTQSQRALARLKSRRDSGSNEPSGDSSPASTPSQNSTDAMATSHGLHAEHVESIKVQELGQAHAIANRLDEVTFLPPFDHDPHLLKLRGMVRLWIADLMIATSTDSQQEADSQRSLARDHLQRAKAHGWKDTESLSQMLDENAEPLSD